TGIFLYAVGCEIWASSPRWWQPYSWIATQGTIDAERHSNDPRELRENTSVVAVSRVRDCRDFAWLGNAVAPAWRGNVCEYEGAMGWAIGGMRLDSKPERRAGDRDRARVAGG